MTTSGKRLLLVVIVALVVIVIFEPPPPMPDGGFTLPPRRFWGATIDICADDQDGERCWSRAQAALSVVAVVDPTATEVISVCDFVGPLCYPFDENETSCDDNEANFPSPTQASRARCGATVVHVANGDAIVATAKHCFDKAGYAFAFGYTAPVSMDSNDLPPVVVVVGPDLICYDDDNDIAFARLREVPNDAQALDIRSIPEVSPHGWIMNRPSLSRSLIGTPVGIVGFHGGKELSFGNMRRNCDNPDELQEIAQPSHGCDCAYDTCMNDANFPEITAGAVNMMTNIDMFENVSGAAFMAWAHLDWQLIGVLSSGPKIFGEGACSTANEVVPCCDEVDFVCAYLTVMVPLSPYRAVLGNIMDASPGVNIDADASRLLICCDPGVSTQKCGFPLDSGS